MKCTYCGFTYDEETVCPICGTPAPEEEQAPSPLPSFEPPLAASAQIAGHAPVLQPEPEYPDNAEDEPPAKQAPQQFKGLRIATLCVLSVMAAALVYLALLQTLAFAQNNKQQHGKASASSSQAEAPSAAAGKPDGTAVPETAVPVTTIPETAVPETTVPDTTVPDTTVQNTTVQTAAATAKETSSAERKEGDYFDFGSGSVTIKSIRQQNSGGVRQAAFTLELINNTDKTQTYRYPDITVDSAAFDKENFLRRESDQTKKEPFTLKPGESVSVVFYYRLPKEDKLLSCIVNAYTVGKNNESRISTAAYKIDTKTIE